MLDSFSNLNNIVKLKTDFYIYLDDFAKNIAINFLNGCKITYDILHLITALYASAKLDAKFKSDTFESAYHNPITSDFEFVISRILFYVSEIKNLKWKIYLRKQKSKCAPDIRIDKGGKTISIIEIKVKVGWIQPFFSDKQFEYAKKLKDEGKSDYDPKKAIEELKNQIDKYKNIFGVDKSDIFMLVSMLSNVHRKKYDVDLQYYKKIFQQNSELEQSNFVVLSNNLNLDLSIHDESAMPFEPSDDLENMLNYLITKS